MKSIDIKKSHHFTGHKSSVYTITPGIDEHSILTAGGDGIVASWDLNEEHPPKKVANVETQIFSIHFLPQYNILFIGQMQGGLHIIDLKKQKELRYLTIHQKAVFDIREDPGYNRILVASGDGTLSSWQLPDVELHKHRSLSGESLRSIALHPFNGSVAVGCSDNNIYILQKEDLKAIMQFEAHENSVFSLRYSPDGKYLISGSRDAQLKVWDVVKNYEICHAVPAHRFTINDICFSPGGEWLATAGRDKEIRIWDAGTYDLLKVIDKTKFEAHVNSVNKLLWQQNGLFSVSDDRSVMGWQIKA